MIDGLMKELGFDGSTFEKLAQSATHNDDLGEEPNKKA